MKNQRKEKRIILFLLIGVILMTVGFATFSGELNISGDVTVKSNKWEVGFDIASYTETTGEKATAASNKNITSDSYTFAVELDEPTKFYEATVNVKNAGTLNAKVTGITMEAKKGNDVFLTEEEKQYFSYTVTYRGQTYTSSTGAIALPLGPGESEPLTVRVDYLLPESSDQLPTADEIISVSGKLEYSVEQ